MSHRWPVLAIALYVHLVPFVVYARDAWAIERLEAQRESVFIDPAAPPVESPPDPCGRHRHVTRDLVQPARETCDPEPLHVHPTPTDPPLVPPTRLHRVSGYFNVMPPEPVPAEMRAAGKGRIAGTFKLCLDTLGRASGVRRMTSTGYDTYDQRITAAMWNWRYQPLVIAGRPVAVCTTVTFRFSIP